MKKIRKANRKVRPQVQSPDSSFSSDPEIENTFWDSIQSPIVEYTLFKVGMEYFIGNI
jgi:hypothetical protein